MSEPEVADGVEGPGVLRRSGVALLAFGIFATAAVFAWAAFTPHHASRGGDGSASGYFIRFPSKITRSGGKTELLITTNLPRGTMYEVRTQNLPDTGEGLDCCPKTNGTTIVQSVARGDCSGNVGARSASKGFEMTLVVRPVFDDFPISVPPGATWHPAEQPASVLRVLGRNFANLRGDQVKIDHGVRELVATARYDWPDPSCGPNPLPLFGDPACAENPSGERLQGSDLKEAMVSVMGTLSQGRMCEFWWVMLPETVRSTHPWPAFATEWRAWLLEQDFSDANGANWWTVGPLTWHVARTDGDRNLVDVTNHGVLILSLEVDFLPNACPTCAKNVVPFWGVTSWQFH